MKIDTTMLASTIVGAIKALVTTQAEQGEITDLDSSHVQYRMAGDIAHSLGQMPPGFEQTSPETAPAETFETFTMRGWKSYMFSEAVEGMTDHSGISEVLPYEYEVTKEDVRLQGSVRIEFIGAMSREDVVNAVEQIYGKITADLDLTKGAEEDQAPE